MTWIDPHRPGVLPVLLFLLALPVYALLPRRWAAAFFFLSGVAFVSVVDGWVVSLGLLVAIVLNYGVMEWIARRPAGWRGAMAVWLGLLHAAYWACFFLPPPEAFRVLVAREADQQPIFILFSGIGLTFFRLVSYAWDRGGRGVGAVSFQAYLAYAFYFPQFRHGPIDRVADLGPQMETARGAWKPADIAAGLGRIAYTFGVVIVLGGAAAGVFWWVGLLGLRDLDDVFVNPERFTPLQILAVAHLPPALLYLLEWAAAGLQLGVGRAFGVKGTENFDHPELATNPLDLWRRWNVTLGRWLRDYAFTPFMHAARSPAVAVVLTFVYCGVLHAPQWRCVAWGLFVGFSIALYVALGRGRRERGVAGLSAWAMVRLAAKRVALYVWISAAVVIIMDPQYCGLRFFARYARMIVGG